MLFYYAQICNVIATVDLKLIELGLDFLDKYISSNVEDYSSEAPILASTQMHKTSGLAIV